MSTINPHIRPLTEADAEIYHELRLRALREHPAAFAQPYESQATTPMSDVAQRLKEASESLHEFILGMFSEGELIGMVGFRRERRERVQHKGTIWGMYIAAEAQGKGFGRLLIREAISRASEMSGLEQINLGVISGNVQARNLYISLGFESYGLEKRAILVNGNYHDDELMQMFLD
ncbi:MAG: GNAT family N-acetyltransferase [Chloroflexi bacterium]|nr:GNAT family N-acetyltransferase [Chloroflexota bacterium]